MEAAAIAKLVLEVGPILFEGWNNAMTVKEVLSSEDQAKVDAAYRELTAKRNALADRLRGIEGDPE